VRRRQGKANWTCENLEFSGVKLEEGWGVPYCLSFEKLRKFQVEGAERKAHRTNNTAGEEKQET